MQNTLERNLAALARLDASLAERMRALAADPAVRVDPTPGGPPSLRARATDGTEIRLHSAYDPIGEGRRFADRQLQEKPDAFLISGLGLAYHACEIASKAPAHVWIFLVEAREELFRAALEHADLAGLFARPRTRVFAGADWVAFLGWLRRILEESEAQHLTLATYPPCVRLAPAFYEQVAAELQSALNRRLVELNTLVHQGETLETNAIRNVAFLPESLGVRDFEGAFAGAPGIVVASGPSLERCADLLRDAQGRAVIVTVGKSLRLLAGRGVEPEFAAALDMTPSNAEVFRGFPIPSRTVLVYDEDCHHEVPRTYPNAKVTYETTTAVMRWAASALGPFGAMEKGLSVAHTAFYFARALGVDPIILVGVDLALPGDRTHAEGVTMTWGGAVDPSNPNLIQLPSVTGGSVRSLRSFLSFVSAFEVEIARTKARVVNTSPDGALIRGAENLSLDEALRRWCGAERPIAGTLQEKAAVRRPFPREGFERAADELEDLLGHVEEKCGSGLRALKRAKRLDRTNRLDAEEIRKLGRRLEATKMELLSGPAARLLSRLASGPALRIRSLGRQATYETDMSRRIELEIEMLDLFFTGFAGAAGFFRKAFREMRDEMRARQGIRA